MSSKSITLDEYKRAINGSGQSTIGAAFNALRVNDDPELRDKAKELIRLEDEFEALLAARDIAR